MTLKQKNGVLEITTTAWQGRHGGIMLGWGARSITLDKEQAEVIALDIPDFDFDDYNRFYNNLWSYLDSAEGRAATSLPKSPEGGTK